MESRFLVALASWAGQPWNWSRAFRNLFLYQGEIWIWIVGIDIEYTAPILDPYICCAQRSNLEQCIQILKMGAEASIVGPTSGPTSNGLRVEAQIIICPTFYSPK